MFENLFTFWRKPGPRAPFQHAGAPAAAASPSRAASPAAARADKPAAAPGNSIDHHPGLINELVTEHAALLKAYGDIGAAMREERWDAVSEQLRSLRSMLTDHLLKEGVQLYCYLQRALDEDDDTYLLFRGFKTEMGGIGKAAFAFVDRYAEHKVLQSPTMQAAFAKEYGAIGNVLADRIRREEAQLYPLYQPPGSMFL